MQEEKNKKEVSQAFVKIAITEIIMVVWLMITVIQLTQGNVVSTSMLFIGLGLALITMLVQFMIGRKKIPIATLIALMSSSLIYVLMIYLAQTVGM